VEDGELKLIPADHKHKWDWWLGNIRHWCISRQLWWGHRIPAYLVKVQGQPAPDTSDPSNWVVARTIEEAMAKACALKGGIPADSITLDQDPDVLDTWFSSGLFPFSTMGWPNEESLDFKAFFPGSLLETGHDILFFWVARMVMMSQTLTDKLPFKEVYLHAMVRDKYGKKMSKSKGNVVDPLDVINGSTLQHLLDTLTNSLLPEKEILHASGAKKKEFPKGIPRCGADALRFGLLAYTSQGRDVNLDINRVIGYRKFCNKLWNLHKLGLYFGLQNITPPRSITDLLTNYTLSEHDRWILSRLHGVMVAVDQAFVDYNMAAACNACYDFLLKEFASTYAEISKPSFRGDDEAPKQAALATFYTVLEISYRLLHPMMPFVTEELWQRLPRAAVTDGTNGTNGESKTAATPAARSIVLAKYPNPAKDSELAKLQNKEAENQMNTVIATADALRSLQGKFLTGKASSAKPKVVLTCATDADLALLTGSTGVIGALCRLDNITCAASGTDMDSGMAVAFVSEHVNVHMMLKGHVDFAAELPSLRQKLAKQVTGKTKLEKKRNPEYLAKANDDIQFRELEILEEYNTKITLLQEQIEMFEKLA
jgi:valyl-tRNA synthetase